jgi:predicted nucleic acid-binding protein
MTTGIIVTASEKIVLDSSGWLEYLTDDVNARAFAPYVENGTPVLMPAVVLYEVFRKLTMLDRFTAAESFYSRALRHPIVPMDEGLAVFAARLSLEYRLAMADAIIYATAQSTGALLVTGDAHFRGLAGATVL